MAAEFHGQAGAGGNGSALDPTSWAALNDPAALQSLAGTVFAAVVFMLLLAGLYRIAPRMWRAMEETLLSNWRLGLLAATGLVLSIASGWTTFDGMRNFTREPVLSLMITFGIQGVMLIIAWIIGESFATGMSQRPAGAPRGTLSKGMQATAGGLIGVMLFVAASILILQGSGQRTIGAHASPGQAFGSDLLAMSDHMLIIVVGLLLAALVALYSASDVVKPYLQSSRVIAKNAVLWVMFLACMATSVFFSFDSLFSAIFPQSERERAAELRAQNQVAGIVSDIGATIETRRLAAADELFRSEGWATYDADMERLAAASRGAESMIEAYYVERMEERRRAIAAQQERIASAESSQSGLVLKKANLTEELSRLEAERPSLVADLQSRKSDLDQRAKEVDAKRVEAMAEEKGVEGTLREGRGPIYRQRMSELAKLQDYYKIGEQRVKDAQKRLDETNQRIDLLKRELAEIDGGLAKLKGEAETAQQRIAAATVANSGDDLPKVDPARVLPAFESARIAFRQKPDVETLKVVQEQCTQLLNAMTSTPATKDRVAGLTCDPKSAQGSAGVLFALNAGAALFAANCVGGDKLAANTTTDALFRFARRCLADSGLPSRETDTLRQRINFVELNRDDKAHRFVVTWNAFQDGNRLAYLALAIAIAIDGLIFMSGLFGANAVRSPLSDVPSYKARSAQQLEAIVENALLPDTFENARLALQAMRPISNVSGFMAEVRPERLDPHAQGRVMAVLNAGATIHAVEYDHAEGRYLVRAELFEFLSTISKKAFESSEHHATQAELEKIIAVSLLPDIAHNVDIVLSHVHPITEKHGFTGEVRLSEVDDAHRRTVRNVLNAGSVHQRVQRAEGSDNHYFVHRDLYKTLAILRARALYTAAPLGYRLEAADHHAADVAKSGSSARALDAARPQLTHQAGTTPEQSPPPIQASAAPAAGSPPASTAVGSSAVEIPPPPPSKAELNAVRDQLLMIIGMAPSIYGDLVRSNALATASVAAEQVRRLCRQHQALGPHIETELSDRLSDLEQAAQAMKFEGYRGAAVDTVHSELAALMPALMIVQGRQYQDILNTCIENLESEEAQGNLSTAEVRLLQRLRVHESALSKISLHTADDWQRVAYLLEDFVNGNEQPHYDRDGEARGRRAN